MKLLLLFWLLQNDPRMGKNDNVLTSGSALLSIYNDELFDQHTVYRETGHPKSSI